MSYAARGVAKNDMGDKQGAIEDLNIAGKLGFKQAYDKIKEIEGK
jgi:hypothetical protein